MRCKAKKIEALYMPNIDVQTIPLVKSSATQFPGYCIPMMGLHPCSVKDNFEIELDRISVELRSGSYAAIGETGIDLYWDKSLKREQILAFQEQLSWARDLDLPIIIHSRESLDLILDILESGSLPSPWRYFPLFYRRNRPGQSHRRPWVFDGYWRCYNIQKLGDDRSVEESISGIHCPRDGCSLSSSYTAPWQTQ